MLSGHTLGEGQAIVALTLKDTTRALHDIDDELLRLSQVGMKAFSPDAAVHVDGTSNLLGDIDDGDARRRQRELLSLLDEQQQVREILDSAAAAPGVRVFIGAENGNSALSSAGVVTSTVGGANAVGAVGVLGVIGPRHLDYSRVVPLVDVTASVLSRLMG
jgi:heat-inducible transcriptional repressor